MKILSKAAVAAVALVASSLASQANAETTVRFMPKGGVPYTYTVRPEQQKVAARPVHYRHVAKGYVNVKTANKADVAH
ncbi:exported hypothetical protein [Hyphomicrobium sp. GJ21]|jgi:hypothetical protein|uniref:hypothetical protein n=1 Tax=unclassified Hyphomicrobium TaxID=2619925 RepID=UPI000622C2F9|nr:hypothetical protein [Hyphomicrobium sp. GJ21]CEJ87951.1 exported hypothetical protein [Hyphomicrobium sp. GJ21]